MSVAIKKNRTPVEEGKHVRNGSSSCCGYKVEARFNSHHAEAAGDQLFDLRWQEVRFDRSNFGVPASRFAAAANTFGDLDMMSYEQAEAMRWWFLAHLEATRAGGCLCWETRLVEYQVSYSRSAKPIEYINAFDCRGDLPKDMAPADVEPARQEPQP
jgi:hypothetical protein